MFSVCLQAGINSGDCQNSYTVDGSGTPDILNVTSTTNVGVVGRWMFKLSFDSETACGKNHTPFINYIT